VVSKPTQDEVIEWERKLTGSNLSMKRGHQTKLVLYAGNDLRPLRPPKTIVKQPTTHHKHCKQCGKGFDSKRSNAKTCSNACRMVFYRNKRNTNVTHNFALSEEAIENDGASSLRLLLRTVQAGQRKSSGFRSMVAEMDRIYREWRTGIEEG
jgi:predicted nucleic acid-binding Zn ribbon protein